MHRLCFLGGMISLAYFLFLFLVFQGTITFTWFWAILGGCFWIMALLLRLTLHDTSFLGGLLHWTLLFILFVCAVIFLYFSLHVLQGMLTPEKEGLPYCLVLGAKVNGKSPSLSFRQRMDVAVSYAKKNEDTLFILTGGQGVGEEISEAQCAYQYLTLLGVDPKRLILEPNSTSTRENLLFSQRLVDQLETLPVGIITNDFHVTRALALARRLGYQDVYGLPGVSSFYLRPNFFVREILGMIAQGLWLP